MSEVEIRNVSKEFGKTKALNNITFKMDQNRIYGLLGRNGAGKTTLLNVIANKYFADGGDVLIDGQPAAENDIAQSKVFHMTDKNLYPQEMKAKEGLYWASEFYPDFDMEYARDLIKKFGLDIKKRINKLSTGYQSIFKLILALASNAPVVLYDEPVLGLDAHHRELFYKELLFNFSERPKLVLVSTHLIDEIATVLEEIIIIKNGGLVLKKPVEEVLQMAYTVSGAAEKVDVYAKGKNVIHQESIGRLKSITVYQERTKADTDAIGDSGLDLAPARLQELFISLTD